MHTRATQVQARATCGDSVAFRSLVPLATTNKRQAIAPAYSACLYAYVTSVLKAPRNQNFSMTTQELVTLVAVKFIKFSR